MFIYSLNCKKGIQDNITWNALLLKWYRLQCREIYHFLCPIPPCREFYQFCDYIFTLFFSPVIGKLRLFVDREHTHRCSHATFAQGSQNDKTSFFSFEKLNSFCKERSLQLLYHQAEQMMDSLGSIWHKSLLNQGPTPHK